VNYSGAAPGNPEGEEFELKCPGAPETVRWHTGLSSALDQGSLRFSLLSLFETFSWSFHWLFVNPGHLYNL
jgi:hypothetical protein